MQDISDNLHDEHKANVLREDLDVLLRQKRDHEEEVFEQLRQMLEAQVLNPRTAIRLKRTTVNGRQVTVFNKVRTGLLFFDRFCALRLTQAFSVRSNGRDQCVRVLSNTFRMGSVGKEANQAILKFDIREFYANIDHEILTNMLANHAGVPKFIEVHVRNILEAQARMTGAKRGLPDGVPTSAVLAEIYLESMDRTLRRNSHFVLYLRYVDDVVIVTEPERVDEANSQIDSVLGSLALERNAAKSVQLIHPSVSPTGLDYLGYRFNFDAVTSKQRSVDISIAKRERYIDAVNRLVGFANSVSCWADTSNVDLYLAACSYLASPHATSDEEHRMRIVSGLAYSARFMRGKAADRQNMRSLLVAIRKEIAMRWGVIGATVSPGGSPLCPCCSRVIARWSDILILMKVVGHEHHTMKSVAVPHEDEQLRIKVGDLLWK